MPHDMQAIKAEVLRLNSQQAVIDLLAPVVRSPQGLSIDDIGWAYWNICDNYAMLRQADEQHAWQAEFFEWSKTSLPAERLHWPVTDGTQAMSLINGGYSDFWWTYTQFANQHAPRLAENRTVRFESHRAAAAACTKFKLFDRAESALNALADLLAEDPQWVNRDFATVTWHTLRIEYFGGLSLVEQIAAHGAEMERYLAGWLARVQRPFESPEPPILGSWAQLNADRPSVWVTVAIHNAACAFAVAGAYPQAERMFDVFIAERRERMNTYSIAMYLLSCWHNRRDAAEVRALLAGFQPVDVQRMLTFAPQLSEVVGG